MLIVAHFLVTFLVLKLTQHVIGEFLREQGNIQVIKNWQSHKYTEQETIRMIKILHKSTF